jgi:prepilin-type N-terminal cleavage/methylation domain-containing protein
MLATRGLTLVEMLVALVLFALGALSLTAETAALLRSLARADRAGYVSRAAATRLERLHLDACTAHADGSEPVRRGSAPLALLHWRWTERADSTLLVRLTAEPAGAAAWRLVRPETLLAVIACGH